MKTKRIISLLMAAAMTLSVGVSAYATSTDVNITTSDKLSTGGTVKVTGETNVGVVKVTVPTAGKLVINPYSLNYKVDDTTTKTDQVIYPTQYITSNSTASLDVTATVAGLPSNNAKLVAEPFDPIATHTAGEKVPNNLFLVMQTKDVAAAATPTEPTWTAIDKDTDITTGDFADDGNGYFHALVVSARGTATKVGKLAASTDTADDAQQTYVAFRLAGLAEKNPSTPWTDKDKVTATIAFTFAPTKTTT